MTFRQKIKTKLKLFQKLPIRYYVITGVLLVAGLYVAVFRERTLVYSYGGETCDQRLILLPDIFDRAGSDKYEVISRGGWSIGGRQITATSVCVKPVVAPVENSTEVVAYAPWASWVARLFYRIEVEAHPAIDASILSEPIAVSRDLVLPLSEPDDTFSYLLEAENREADCETLEGSIACDIPALDLKQGSKYNMALTRQFKDEVLGEVVSASVETLSPLSVTKSSIKNGSVVYDKPSSITIETDKPIAVAHFTARQVNGDSPVGLEVVTDVDDKKVVVGFEEDLPRQAEIELRAVSFEADDGSTPLDDYLLKFKTSGGPKVVGVNAGSSGVPMGSQVIVTFDQDLSKSQDIGSLATVKGGLSLQAVQGRQLVFSTSSASRCGSISIVLKSGIQSRHDIPSKSGWTYNGRMMCQSVAVIGYSTQGRSITAHSFGLSGPVTLYVGAIHGNESSSSGMLKSWINHLEANPNLYEDRRVVVVPTANPDGVIAGTRDNARGVNINRNFPTDGWKTDVNDTDGFKKGGAGKKPLSEPESRALSSLTSQLMPRLVVSLHAVGSLVVGDPGGYSAKYAAKYANTVGYRDVTYEDSPFNYDTFGGYEDWAFSKQGIPSMIVELGDYVYYNFQHHRLALEGML